MNLPKIPIIKTEKKHKEKKKEKQKRERLQGKQEPKEKNNQQAKLKKITETLFHYLLTPLHS